VAKFSVPVKERVKYPRGKFVPPPDPYRCRQYFNWGNDAESGDGPGLGIFRGNDVDVHLEAGGIEIDDEFVGVSHDRDY